MSQAVQLALGTVQFGMTYGIAGRGSAVPEHEVREILSAAWQAGIRTLDTASAYGDIEERLAGLVQGRRFDIASKIPAAPAAADLVEHARQSVARILARLGDSVRAILFHRAGDLSAASGEAAWSSAAAALAGKDIKLGVSCYSPAELGDLQARFPIAIAQLPGNALDQRLQGMKTGGERYPEIHLRSAFLQGLLLMPEQEAVRRVPKAATALQVWHSWCREHELAPLRAALSIVKGMPAVQRCVIGVDSLSQLEEILAAWRDATPVQAPSLAAQSEDVIDPRRW